MPLYRTSPGAILIALTALAACSQSAVPQIPASAQELGHNGSWMLREAKRENLLYLSGSDGRIAVLSYPGGKVVGTIGKQSSNPFPGGECTDAKGDIFVTATNEQQVGTIYEYAHGGLSPIAMLSDPGEALGCAVDSKTGDLAVANFRDVQNSDYFGDIAIYKSGQGTPTIYKDARMSGALYCGYDQSGNLFATVQTDSFYGATLFELARGSSTLEPISIAGLTLHGAGRVNPDVQWDGKYMTVSGADHSGRANGPLGIYRLSISGSSATVVGTTVLTVGNGKFFGQGWIQGSSIVYADRQDDSVSFWKYPNGGKAYKTLGNVLRLVQGAAVSLASNH